MSSRDAAARPPGVDSRQDSHDAALKKPGQAFVAARAGLSAAGAGPGRAADDGASRPHERHDDAAAQAKLGARFDLRSFHDAVLKGGTMPLEVLARVVDDWVKGA